MPIDSDVQRWIEKNIDLIDQKDYTKLCEAIAQDLTTVTCIRLFAILRDIDYDIPEEYRWAQVKNMIDNIIDKCRQYDETYIADNAIITRMPNLVGFRIFDITHYLDDYQNRYATRHITHQGRGFIIRCN